MWRTGTCSAVSGIVWNGAAQASMAASSLNQKRPNTRHVIETLCSPEADTNLARAHSCRNTGNAGIFTMQTGTQIASYYQ